MPTAIDPQEFLRVMRPALEAGDPAALARTIEVRWRVRDLCGLLRDPDVDVRCVAAVTLGLAGDSHAIGPLTRALRDDAPRVNEMAEHALWSIWFRSGAPEASQPFRAGVASLSVEAYEPAIRHFERATRIDPLFAEAFNQCAIAQYFLSNWEESIACSRKAVCLLPTHFGAIAGMGHCFTQRGELGRALRCYQRALQINPRMTTIARMARRLEEHQRRRNDHSGIYVASCF